MNNIPEKVAGGRPASRYAKYWSIQRQAYIYREISVSCWDAVTRRWEFNGIWWEEIPKSEYPHQLNPS